MSDLTLARLQYRVMDGPDKGSADLIVSVQCSFNTMARQHNKGEKVKGDTYV